MTMTWEELKEKAKAMGAEIVDNNPYRQEKILFKTTSFYKNGRMITEEPNGDSLVGDFTPDQMWKIMEALQ